MRLAIPDLVSNSYFPAAAAGALGFYAQEGLDLTVELISPIDACVKALRDGRVEFIGASAHAPLLAFDQWRGAKLLCAQSQGMYWFLVMRTDLAIPRGDLESLKGRRIAAVPFVAVALERLLIAAGIDPKREGITIGPPPGALGPGVNFGVVAAAALERKEIDGFFANGMGAALAQARGIGTIVLDVRRGDGPPECFHYTMPAIATSDELIARNPAAAERVIRAIARTHAALKRDPSLAAEAGRKLFPSAEAGLIEQLVARDAPYYDQRITAQQVGAINRFARDLGWLPSADIGYEHVVAQQFIKLWNE